MNKSSVIDPSILVQYIVMRFDDSNQTINTRLMNDILYSIQLCYMRHTGDCLFTDSFMANPSGPELVKSFDRDYSRQLVKSVITNSSVSELLMSWVTSILHTDSSDLHKIATNSMSPWSVRYQSGMTVVIPNDDLLRYANADKYDSLEGTYLENYKSKDTKRTYEVRTNDTRKSSSPKPKRSNNNTSNVKKHKNHRRRDRYDGDTYDMSDNKWSNYTWK